VLLYIYLSTSEDGLMSIYDSEYILNLFDLIITRIGENVKEPEKCWFKASCGGEPIAYTKLKSLSDKNKKTFVWSMVLIHGFIGKTLLHGLEYKRQGGKNNLHFDMDLAFETDKDKKEYIEFREFVISADSSVEMLDAVLED